MKKFIDLIIDYGCPDETFGELDLLVKRAPFRDPTTSVYDTKNKQESKIIGCRGITCVECWNQESEE